MRHEYRFWATVCKTVRPMLSVRCLSVLSVCLSVCDVRALWPNGWTDPDDICHAGRPRPWPHRVRWDPPQGVEVRISKLDRTCGALPVIANFVALEWQITLAKTRSESV